MTANAQLAASTLGNLAALGVRNVVVCAGARNAPLVTTLLLAGETCGFTIFHHFDERAASFFALGLSKRSGEPAAVITTSGTAAAELFPAAVEAFYSGNPLVLVTADRPKRYRGSGAPQAIEQKGLFGTYAPVSLDVDREWGLEQFQDWDRGSPVHLNVCFEEPQPEDAATFLPEVAPIREPEGGHKENVGSRIAQFLENDDRGAVVILGELPSAWQNRVEAFLVRLGVPIWAECTSGLRESEALANLLIRFEKQLSTAGIGSVIRIGGVPSLRFWRDLEEVNETQVLSIAANPFSGLARESELVVVEEFPEISDISRRIAVKHLQGGDSGEFAMLLEKYPTSEPAMIRRLAAAIPSDALVFLGNSLPIREWNLAAPCEVPHPRCFASRGANGIDGQISTFLGLSRGERESWGIFGDLTSLYDLNAPALLEQLPDGKRRIVTINNGGGRIFSRLPSLSGLSESSKEVTENRHGRRFEAWAEMWNMDYRSWDGSDDFLLFDSEAYMLEVFPDNNATEAFWKEWK